MLVKPAPGISLRDPATKVPVPDTGLEVPDNSPLWSRMIAEGDVVQHPAPAPEAPAEPQDGAEVEPPAADAPTETHVEDAQ